MSCLSYFTRCTCVCFNCNWYYTHATKCLNSSHRLRRDFFNATTRAEKLKLVERGVSLYWPYYSLFLDRPAGWSAKRELNEIRAYGNKWKDMDVNDYREIIPA